MFVLLREAQTWLPETEGTPGVHIGNLQHFLFSRVLTNVRPDTSPNILVVQNSNIRDESMFPFA